MQIFISGKSNHIFYPAMVNYPLKMVKTISAQYQPYTFSGFSSDYLRCFFAVSSQFIRDFANELRRNCEFNANLIR